MDRHLGEIQAGRISSEGVWCLQENGVKALRVSQLVSSEKNRNFSGLGQE